MKARLAAFLVVLSMIGAAREAAAITGNTPPGEALTISNTGSPNFTQGATGCTSTSVAFNSNSFVTCNSGAWAVQPVQIGTSASAPQTCSSTFEGMVYLNSSSGVLYYCDNANTWEAIDSFRPERHRRLLHRDRDRDADHGAGDVRRQLDARRSAGRFRFDGGCDA